MASGMGTPSQYGTANMIQRLMSNPLYQQEIARGMNVGQDKRAVGGLDRALGGAIASEQKSMMAKERAGEELARRKDNLAFQKKLAKQQQKNWEAKQSFERENRDFNFAAGLVSTGINTWTTYQERQRQKQRNEDHELIMKKLGLR